MFSLCFCSIYANLHLKKVVNCSKILAISKIVEWIDLLIGEQRAEYTCIPDTCDNNVSECSMYMHRVEFLSKFGWYQTANRRLPISCYLSWDGVQYVSINFSAKLAEQMRKQGLTEGASHKNDQTQVGLLWFSLLELSRSALLLM